MIEYCLSNVDDDTRQRLRSVSDATEASCLEHCGICYLEPFLVVDGDLRCVESHESALADCNYERSLEKRERDGSTTEGEP